MNKAVGFVLASLQNSAYCKEEKSLSRQVMGGKHTAIRLLASRPPRWTTFLTIRRAFSKCPRVHASGLFVDNEMAFKRPAPADEASQPQSFLPLVAAPFTSPTILIRWAMQPAPKPLSIFITPTPAAQEFSMVNNAAKPPKCAP